MGSQGLELVTELGLRLRRYELADAEALFEKIEKNRHRLPPRFPDLESLQESFLHPLDERQLRFGMWADAELVGTVNVTPMSDTTAEIGYWIDEDFEGRGMTTDAVRTMARYVATQTDYSEVIATTLKDNRPSQRVLEKAGFELAGDDPSNPSFSLYRYVR